MENLDLLTNDLEVTPSSQSFLKEAAKWARFLSVVGFIFCGFMVIMAFFLPSLLLNLPPYNQVASSMVSGLSAGLTILYLVIAIVFFFPCLFMNRFGVKMKLALTSVSQENFETSLQNLKSLFKFYGIVTIIILSLYALIFIVAIVMGGMGAMS